MIIRRPWVCLTWLAMIVVITGPDRARAQEASSPGTTVTITQPDESHFPEISVYFEVKRADGTFVLDASSDAFRVTEDDHERPIISFEAPQEVVARPTTLVLVVDRSRSMLLENRVGGLKRAVAQFLEGLPQGSRIAVIAFGNHVEILQPFTSKLADVRAAVDSLEPAGGTRFFDAVAAAQTLLEHESGRRAILALTDGEDTISQNASPKSVILAARRLGVPIHTLGLGTGQEVTGGALTRLASETRGEAYNADHPDQLRAIYEEIARRLGSTYRLTYRTDRPLRDGTLRPIRIFHRESTQAAESAVFIPGMVALAPGWPGLFLGLVGSLVLVSWLPGWMSARTSPARKDLA